MKNLKSRRLNVVNVLKEARAIMVTGWTQHRFRSTNYLSKDGPRQEMCAMGGIDEAVARLNNGKGLTEFTKGRLSTTEFERFGHGGGAIPKNPRTPKEVAQKAGAYLRAAVVNLTGNRNATVIAYNDNLRTSKSDVLKAFDKAIGYARRRHMPKV